MKLSMSYRLATIALGLSSASLVLVACSSDDNSNNPPITVVDSGAQQDSTVTPSGDSGPGPGTDSSVPPVDSGPLPDSNLPDVGNCVSEASTCNSCYTVVQDPLGACSPYSVNCIPFDNTRVPSSAP
jgi:hypothetical protein